MRLYLSHPKVYSNGGYKVASQKGPIFKAHQDARLPHGWVSQQHHLEQTHHQREGQQVTAGLNTGWQPKQNGWMILTEQEIRAKGCAVWNYLVIV